MLTTVPEETVHTPGYGSGTIPAVTYDAALPAEVFPCPAGVFSGKMVSLKMMLLHYLMFLLEIIKDEEDDADMALCVCLTMSVWNHNWTHSVVA